MSRNLSFAGLIIFYGLCLPVAIFSGYLLATPTAFTSFTLLSVFLLLMIFPLFLKWHHEMLVLTWNSFLIVFFLPGQVSLVMVFALANLFLAIVDRTMRKRSVFLPSDGVTRALVVFTVVVVVTMVFTGGFGSRILGSTTFGGKRYIALFSGVIGYFGLISKRIPVERAHLLGGLFFLSGVAAAVSDFAYLAGPKFYFLYVLFPAYLASAQVITQETVLRFAGLTFGSLAVCYYLLASCGVGGLFDFRKPWRMLLFAGCFAASLLGGFRSTVVILALVFFFQFLFEGQFRTGLFPVLIAVTLLVSTATLMFLDRMPLSVQRSLSFLPVKVDPVAKHDALASLDWRFHIWRAVWPEVPQYLWLGKGYAFNGTDLYLTEEAIKRGYYNAYEDILVDGNYHNGILTLIIPFGIFGIAAFGWFCWASLRVLHKNYKYGDPALKGINTFLLAYFYGRLVFYLVFYGQSDLDLMIFTGVVGLSLSLNGGAVEPSPAPVEELVPARPAALAY